MLTQICRTFWEEYVGPESLIVDTLGVYCSYFTTICIFLKEIFQKNPLKKTHQKQINNKLSTCIQKTKNTFFDTLVSKWLKSYNQPNHCFKISDKSVN